MGSVATVGVGVPHMGIIDVNSFQILLTPWYPYGRYATYQGVRSIWKLLIRDSAYIVSFPYWYIRGGRGSPMERRL